MKITVKAKLGNHIKSYGPLQVVMPSIFDAFFWGIRVGQSLADSNQDVDTSSMQDKSEGDHTILIANLELTPKIHHYPLEDEIKLGFGE